MCFSADNRTELFCTLNFFFVFRNIKIFIDYDLSLLERKTGRLFITQKKVQNWRWLDSSSFPYRYYIFCFRRKDTCGTGKILPAPAPFASLCGRPRSCQILFYLLPARGPSFPHDLSLWLRLVDHSGTYMTDFIELFSKLDIVRQL